MIMWDGLVMHEGIQRYLLQAPKPALAWGERCVNEEAPGCAGRAEENGWCRPCWETICPPTVASAVTEPFETGCGRR